MKLTACLTYCSNASCTTNCLAPFVKVMDEEFGQATNYVSIISLAREGDFHTKSGLCIQFAGIVKGTMTTTHSYTGDQVINHSKLL